MRKPDLANFSFKDLDRTLVGVVAIAVCGAVLAAVFAVGTLGLLKQRYAMSGVFTDSGGIGKGDQVQMAGVEIGAVTGVHPDFGLGQVIVTWEIDKGIELGPNTSAEISLSTLLGGHYVRLDGPVVKPYLSSVPKARRRIPLGRTHTPTSIDAALNSTTHAVEQLNTTNVNTLLAQLAQITADNQDNLGSLLKNLTIVSAAINQRDEELQDLVANSQKITATLAAKDQALAQLVDSASGLLDELIKRRDQLKILLGTGAQAVTTLSNLIDDHQAQLDAIIGDLHVAIGAATRQLPAVDQGLAFIGPAFVGFSKSGKQGPWVDAVAYGLPALDLINLLNQLPK